MAIALEIQTWSLKISVNGLRPVSHVGSGACHLSPASWIVPETQKGSTCVWKTVGKSHKHESSIWNFRGFPLPDCLGRHLGAGEGGCQQGMRKARILTCNKVCDIFVLVPWKRELGEVKKWLSSKEFGLVWLFFFFQSVGTQWTRSFLPPWEPFTHLLVSTPWFFFEELPFPIFGPYNLSGYLPLRTPEGDKWPQPGQWPYFSSLARVLLRDIAQ